MNKIKMLLKNLIIVVSLSLSANSIAAMPVQNNVVTDAEDQKMILYYVNLYRAKHHLALLEMSNIISKEAEKHSRDMATKVMPVGHNDFNGRIKRLYQQIPQSLGGAENVAFYEIAGKK